MNSVNTRPYHHGHLREELVRIAVELATEGGPEAVVLREAARRAGVSASAAYRHFQGQDALLDAVRRAAVDGLRRRMDTEIARLPADADVRDRVEAAGRGYFLFGVEESPLFRVLTDGMLLDADATARKETTGDGADAFGRLLGLVRTAVPGADQDEVVATAVSLWSAVHGYTVLCTTGALSHWPRERRLAVLPGVLAPALRALDG